MGGRFAKSPLRLAVGIFILAVVVRVAFVMFFAPAAHIPIGPANPGYYATDGYQQIAHTMAAGKGLRFTPHAEFTVTRTPIAPAIYAVCYRLFHGSEVAIAFANILFGSLGCALFAVVAWYAFGSRVALITGLLMVFHPQLVLYSWHCFTESIQSFFTALFVLCLVFMWQKRNIAWGVLTGLTFGLAVLSKGYLFGFAAMLFPVFLLTRNKEGRRGWASAAACLVGLICIMAPWWIRNYRVSGHFIPVTTATGYVYLVGNEAVHVGGKYYIATAYVKCDKMLAAAGIKAKPWIKTPRGTYRDLSPDVDKFFAQVAALDVKQHPGLFVKKVLIGIPRFWCFASDRMRSAMAAFMSFPLLLIAILGTPRLLRSGSTYVPIVLPVIFSNLAFAVVLSEFRYSMPICGLMFAYAVAAGLLLLNKDLSLGNGKNKLKAS